MGFLTCELINRAHRCINKGKPSFALIIKKKKLRWLPAPTGSQLPLAPSSQCGGEDSFILLLRRKFFFGKKTQYNSQFWTQYNSLFWTQYNSPFWTQYNSLFWTQYNSLFWTQNNSLLWTQYSSLFWTQNNSLLWTWSNFICVLQYLLTSQYSPSQYSPCHRPDDQSVFLFLSSCSSRSALYTTVVAFSWGQCWVLTIPYLSLLLYLEVLYKLYSRKD